MSIRFRAVVLTLAVALSASVGSAAVASASAPAGAPPTVAPAVVAQQASGVNSAFVKAAYADFLSRPPTADETTSSAAALDSGQLTRAGLLRGLSTSDEWLGAIVTKMYQDTLGRGPDAAGLATWIGWLRTGRVTVAQAAAGFYSSDEFYTGLGGGTLPTWITQLYRKLLLREPDPAGLSGWAAWAANPAYGKPWVALQFYQSLETRMIRVRNLYQTLLKRDPDTTGWPFWADRVRTDGDLSLAVSLAESLEYWDKASSRFPTPRAAVSVSLGYFFACAVTSAGGVACWGANDRGQLGDGTTTYSADPVDVVGLGNAVQSVVADNTSACALSTSGAVSCWGAFAQTSSGDSSVPVPVAGLSAGVKAVAVGDMHRCAVTGSGSVACWGQNGNGELGPTAPYNGWWPTPYAVPGTTGTTSLSASKYHTCAVVQGGVKCWGAGPLGDGTPYANGTPTTALGLGSGVHSVHVGSAGDCAITDTAAVWCWGDNSQGQLGPAVVDAFANAPVQVVAPGSGYVDLGIGEMQVCGLTATAGVRCWGGNGTGELGDGTTTSRATAADVVGLGSPVVSVSTRSYASCAVLSTGGVRCWGQNAYDLMGGAPLIVSTPVAIPGFP